MTQPYSFNFGQEMTLQDSALKGSFEIEAQLVTDKGNHILAGLIKIQNNQLLHSQGHSIKIGLSNCLDSLATCELKVIKIRNLHMRKGP